MIRLQCRNTDGCDYSYSCCLRWRLSITSKGSEYYHPMRPWLCCQLMTTVIEDNRFQIAWRRWLVPLMWQVHAVVVPAPVWPILRLWHWLVEYILSAMCSLSVNLGFNRIACSVTYRVHGIRKTTALIIERFWRWYDCVFERRVFL